MAALNPHVIASPTELIGLAELPSLAKSIEAPETCVVIGNFDGVHRGHQLLFTEAAKEALPVLALTFDPHPRETFGLSHHRLLTTDERVALLSQCGASRVVVLRFDATLAAFSPTEFVQRILLETLHMRSLILGHDFGLGKAREGTGDVLDALGHEHGFAVRHIPALMDAGLAISSSRIRNLLAESDVQGAAHLLGRPHRVSGKVVKGFQRGRTIGFPTANLEQEHPGPMLPGIGVYATRTRTPDGHCHPSVTNIGRNPTFGNEDQTVETHILDFSGDLYGALLHVEFVARLRGEVKFSGIDALKTQIFADTELARSILIPQKGRP